MDFREVSYPFFVISKWFGYTYFDLNFNRKKPKGNLCFRFQFILKSLTIITIVCGNVLLNVQQIIFAKKFAKGSFTTNTGQILSSSLFICTAVMYILSMAHSLYFRREVRLMLDKFVRFDEIFERHFESVNHLKHRRLVLGYIIGSVLMSLCIVPASMWILEGHSWSVSYEFCIEFLFFGYASSMNYVVLQSHSILAVAAVLYRIKAVNKELFETLAPYPRELNRGQSLVERVQQCRVLLDLLNDIVDLINLCFAFHAMWCTLSCVGYSLMSLYSNYEIFTGMRPLPKGSKWKFIYVNLFWNCFYTFYSVSIVIVSSRMRAEANQTSKLVHKIINDVDDPNLIEEVEIINLPLIEG